MTCNSQRLIAAVRCLALGGKGIRNNIKIRFKNIPDIDRTSIAEYNLRCFGSSCRPMRNPVVETGLLMREASHLVTRSKGKKGQGQRSRPHRSFKAPTTSASTTGGHFGTPNTRYHPWCRFKPSSHTRTLLKPVSVSVLSRLKILRAAFRQVGFGFFGLDKGEFLYFLSIWEISFPSSLS